ncbi:MAG TPA: Gmad2 immunoglobulin-like domain-containing protein, partial [Arthrobacter sp.]|nr:Gmad2 immunoglobulin-like domain-containing protein [Arthrobacter sp.]
RRNPVISREQHHRPHHAAPRFRAWLAVLTLGSMVMIGCTPSGNGPNSQTSMPASSGHPTVQTSPLVTSAPVETLQSTALSPVYWLGTNAETVFLYREFRETEDLGDPITSAVSAVTKLQPLDPDYFNPWQPASKVGASITNGSVITLDISSDAFESPVDAGIAERAVQQLVYTATAAAANAGLSTADNPLDVVILVDGHSGYKAFGHVELGGPMSRDASLSAPIWIIDPQQGASAEGRVEVYGRGVAFESKLSWRISRLDSAEDTGEGTSVKDGTVPVDSAAGETGEFRFSQELDPGTYRLTVFHQDMSGRSEEPQNADSKVFTVK